jgi:hypothetical protein
MASIVDISEALLLLGLSATVTDEERAIVSHSITAAEGAIKRHLKYDPVYAERTEFYPAMDARRSGQESVMEVNATSAYERMLSDSRADELQLRHIPIRSITSLYIDYDGRAGQKAGSFAASTQKTSGTDFWVNFDGVDSDAASFSRDGLVRSQGLWPAQAGSIKIVYYAGYKQKELRGQDAKINAAPIWEACLEEVTRRVLKVFSRKKKLLAGFSGPLISENLGDYSYQTNTEVLNALISGTDLLPESREKLAEFENYGIMLSS